MLRTSALGDIPNTAHLHNLKYHGWIKKDLQVNSPSFSTFWYGASYFKTNTKSFSKKQSPSSTQHVLISLNLNHPE